MVNVLGWLRLGWLEICKITSTSLHTNNTHHGNDAKTANANNTSPLLIIIILLMQIITPPLPLLIILMLRMQYTTANFRTKNLQIRSLSQTNS